MARYADIDKAIEQVKRAEKFLGKKADSRIVNSLIQFLDTLETEDVTPVVHCKDCKFFERCSMWCKVCGGTMSKNGFCSAGQVGEKHITIKNWIRSPKKLVIDERRNHDEI